MIFTYYLKRHNFICKKKLIKKKNKDLNPLFLKNTFSPILIKEKEFIFKKYFWTILLKINFWDNFIYKTIFIKQRNFFDNVIKNKFSNSIKNNSFGFF